ncbi:trehalose operon repressor [Gemella cuniculi]|uniref:trehalose operon repressor n=1 Tax=Gemella cuniculi TaxID=150240 RepID=UPI0004024FA1|nr:trehalose operon repressor [Gemella cuniculi]
MNKFFKIYLELKEKIESREYRSNSLLPSENDLAKEYDVSRETIRKALLLLLENGYIHKIQGKGSIVLDVHKYRVPVTGLISFKERQELQNLETETKVLINEEVEAPEFLIKLGFVKKGERLIYLLRQRIIEGEAVILDKDYIKKNIIGNLPTARVEESLYEYLEKDLGIKISYGNKDFKIERVSEEDIRYIDLNGNEHIAVLRSDVYTEGTDFLHYTESRHRVDKFYFSEFARRTSNKSN